MGIKMSLKIAYTQQTFRILFFILKFGLKYCVLEYKQGRVEPFKHTGMHAQKNNKTTRQG